MSNFTNYLIEAQDLDVAGGAVFNAFERRTYKDFKICWPTLREISAISQYKITEPDEEKGIKGDTSSLRKKIKQLEKAGHIRRLGVLCTKKKKITAMYWVNYGTNDLITDVRAFIHELRTHPRDHRLVDEKIGVLNKFLADANQPVDNPVKLGDYTGSEKPSQTGSEKPSALGLRNPVEIPREPLTEIEVGADAPSPSIFEQLEPEDRIKALRIKAKPYLHDLLARLVLETPEFDNRDFAIRGEIAGIMRTLKELDAERGRLDTDFIMERYKVDLATHMELTRVGKFTQFKTLISWLKDYGWNSEKYRTKPREKKPSGQKYDPQSDEYKKQLAETKKLVDATERASEARIREAIKKQNLGEKASDPEFAKEMLRQLANSMKPPVSTQKQAENEMRAKNAAKYAEMSQIARDRQYET